MKKEIKYFSKLIKLFKLETMTTTGRVNLAAIVVLVIFVIAYTANDMICYGISAVRDAIKTYALKTDISDPYKTISVFKLMIPVILLIVFCLLYLHINEQAKKKIDNKN